MKAIFEPIDLKFGRYIVHTCVRHVLYVVFILFFENCLEYFSLHLIFFKNIRLISQNFETLSLQLCIT